MAKRSRRKASEIDKLRNKMLKIVQREGEISLTNMVRQYGASVGVKDTPSDKNLAKRQLDVLAKSGSIRFQRHGRELIARSTSPAPPQAAARPVAAVPQPAAVAAVATPGLPTAPPPATPLAASGQAGTPQLAAIRLYTHHMRELSNSLQQQVSGLVQMIVQASGQ